MFNDFGYYPGSVEDKLRAFPVSPFAYNGVKIIFSEYALRDTEVRNFPVSRHRSKRVFKKLIKRYGSEYVKKPCMYQVAGDGIVAHPSYRAEIERKLKNV